MRLLSETKLAIDDLYDRCTKREVNQSQETETSDEKVHLYMIFKIDMGGKNANFTIPGFRPRR
jgi:hypothetical protein